MSDRLNAEGGAVPSTTSVLRCGSLYLLPNFPMFYSLSEAVMYSQTCALLIMFEQIKRSRFGRVEF
jgi:hypothetical protein